MYPTLMYVGATDPPTRIRNPVVDGDEVYVETLGDGVTRLIRIAPGEAPRELATVENGHPAGCLIACEDAVLICRRRDNTLVAIERDGGRSHVLRKLVPAPATIAIAADLVVWCSAGGEIWRWWRDTELVERLGTCDAREPALAVRPLALPNPPERIAADVAIAAQQQIGLIDAEDVDWIAKADDPIEQLACTARAIAFTTRYAVGRCDLDTEEVEQHPLEYRPAALAVRESQLFVATNCAHVIDPDGTVTCSPTAYVTTYDLDSESVRSSGPLDDPTWVRGAMQLAAGAHGLVLVEDASTFDGVDRVRYLPYEWQATNWYATLQVQRWLPDGSGCHVMLEQGDWWCGAASGHVPADVTERVNAWILQSFDGLETEERVPRERGWQISIGQSIWFAAHDDYVSIGALRIAKLVAILAPHVPTLAAFAR